jgi:hypothetical protein
MSCVACILQQNITLLRQDIGNLENKWKRREEADYIWWQGDPMLAEVICNHTKRRTPWTKVTIGHRSVWVEWSTRRTYRNYGERLEGGGPFWLGFWRLVGVTSGVTQEPRGPVDFAKIENEMMNKLTNSTIIPIVPCGSNTLLTYYRKKMPTTSPLLPITQPPPSLNYLLLSWYMRLSSGRSLQPWSWSSWRLEVWTWQFFEAPNLRIVQAKEDDIRFTRSGDLGASTSGVNHRRPWGN